VNPARSRSHQTCECPPKRGHSATRYPTTSTHSIIVQLNTANDEKCQTYTIDWLQST